MSTQIGVHAPAKEVLDWLARPEHARHWLAQLRREADGLPQDVGLSREDEAGVVRWSAAPAGHFRVEDKGETAELFLLLDAPYRSDAGDPPEADAADDPDSRAEDALRSIKSHVENMDGGDPTTHDPREVSSRMLGESATFDPDV